MLLLRVYEQWRGISFLGDHFSAVARGRKLCVLIFVYLGSAFVGMCCFVQVCGGKLIFLVLCRRRDCLSWGYWCPCWDHWSGCGYTAGRRFFPIIPWSWFFMGTLWPDRVPWQTLTVCIGCPPLCVRIPVSLRQRKVCLPLVNWLSFVRWFFFWSSTQTVFTSVSRVVPEYESSRMMISAQMRTGQRVVAVHHCVTVAFLTPFFRVRNFGETLSARWRIPMPWESSLCFL